MCDSCANGADAPVCIDDFLTLVAEDRAEFSASALPFHPVGQVAARVLTKSQAAAAWYAQVAIVSLNERNPLIKVAAQSALDAPTAHNISVLIREAAGTPWHIRILEVAGMLVVAHADTVFASE